MVIQYPFGSTSVVRKLGTDYEGRTIVQFTDKAARHYGQIALVDNDGYVRGWISRYP